MKRVLIITYYWPPSGGAGVQRWLKFVKYLHAFGWQAVVYTPSNPEAPAQDDSLLNDIPDHIEVLKTPIWEPYTFYKKFTGQKKSQKINSGFLSENEKPKLAEKISVWIRGNLFIPDARKYWVRPSVKFLTEYLAKKPVDALVSTGPPHSMHLIAMQLKQQNKIPWLADFRDPWTNIDYYKDLMLTKRADAKHHQLEKLVLQQADAVVAVGRVMADEFKTISGRDINVITNGYDEDDLKPVDNITPDDKFSIAHIGAINKDRNPANLWLVLEALVKENELFSKNLLIKLIGKVDIHVLNEIEKHGLKPFLKKMDYLPHDAVIGEQMRSQVLLLLLNNTPNARGILTGKLFEYLSAGRPIVCIGPLDGDAAKIISETNSGITIPFNEKDLLKSALLNFFNQFQTGQLSVNVNGAEKYSRKALTSELANVLNQITTVTK